MGAPRPCTPGRGYDAARLIGSALKATGGDVSDPKAAFGAAVKKADFDSVRGKFKFGVNNHPVQDMYVRKVVKTAEGTYTNETLQKVFTDHVDAYAGLCRQ